MLYCQQSMTPEKGTTLSLELQSELVRVETEIARLQHRRNEILHGAEAERHCDYAARDAALRLGADGGNVERMSRRELEALPYRGARFSDEVGFDSLVLLPLRTKHETGFRCIDVVGVRQKTPVCRLAGDSDVVHIEGISGQWTIDCLPVTGLFRLWAADKIRVGTAVSNLEVFSE
jgi:hypothetical protein